MTYGDEETDQRAPKLRKEKEPCLSELVDITQENKQPPGDFIPVSLSNGTVSVLQGCFPARLCFSGP